VLFHFSGCFCLVSRGVTVAGRRTSIPPAAAIHGRHLSRCLRPAPCRLRTFLDGHHTALLVDDQKVLWPLACSHRLRHRSSAQQVRAELAGLECFQPFMAAFFLRPLYPPGDSLPIRILRKSHQSPDQQIYFWR